MLAGLGTRQLAGYQTAEPDAYVCALLYPERLVVDLADARSWRGLTWETILAAYAHSDYPWVATTARAWLLHLDAALPKVGPETIWNDLSRGAAGHWLADWNLPQWSPLGMSRDRA